MKSVRMIALVSAAAATILATAAAARAQGPKPDDGAKLEDTPKLTVRGDAQLERPADRVTLSIGVVSEDKTAAAALNRNSDLMKDVIAAVERAGLTKDDYQTGRFEIRPTYEQRPRQPSAEWKPKITGYEVINRIEVRTKKLELTGALIEAANEAGANTVDVTGFDLADPRAYRAEAIREATLHAIDDARTIAGAASLDLVRIVGIHLDSAPVEPVRLQYNMRGRAMAEAVSEAPPIAPGDVTIRAEVTIVYEIAPAPGAGAGT